MRDSRPAFQSHQGRRFRSALNAWFCVAALTLASTARCSKNRLRCSVSTLGPAVAPHCMRNR